jgi:hypothetical protein
MAPTLFRLLLLAIVAYALWRGGRDERMVAGLCAFGFAATALLLAQDSNRFNELEIGVMLVDFALLLGFVAVALASSRFWPLWVAGLQLTTNLGHVLKVVSTDLFPQAYAAALYFWAYPIILILAVGTWRSDRRRKMGARQVRAA